MSGCGNERYNKMLELYLVDLLGEEDREEFELHLLHCGECAEEVIKSNKMSMHLLNSPGARQLVPQILDDSDTAAAKEQDIPSRSEKAASAWVSRLPIVLAAAAVLVLLILNPWHIEISPEKKAEAKENRLAIMPFMNIAGDGGSVLWGIAASNLLITDLSESQVLQVISEQQLKDILKALGQEDITSFDSKLATQVANRARARWLFMATIRQIEPQLALEVFLIDAEQGDTINHKQLTGNNQDDIFAIVDKLTLEIKNSLASYLTELKDGDRPVSELTTTSPQAYFHYIEGLDMAGKLYYGEAIENFNKALTYDSTFAMAYYQLSLLTDSELIYKALEFSDKTSRKDKFYIKSRIALREDSIDLYVKILKELVTDFPDEKDAYYRLGMYYQGDKKFDSALGFYSKVLELDPLYKLAYNQLAYLYSNYGKYDSALWAINKYIAISPEDANPYDSRGEIYANHGEYDLAIDSYEMALKKKPDFFFSAAKLADLYHFKRDFENAEKYYKWNKTDSSFENRVKINLKMTQLLLSRGRLDSAINILDDDKKIVIKFAKHGDDVQFYYDNRVTKIIALMEKDLPLAQREIEEVIEFTKERKDPIFPFLRQLYSQILAENGQFDRAWELVNRMKAEDDESKKAKYNHYYAAGVIELAQGNPDSAVFYLKKITEFIPPEGDFISRFMLARAYIGTGRYDDAITELVTQLNIFSTKQFNFANWRTKIYYYLGIANEKAGYIEKAKKTYGEFLNIWKEADPDIDALQDARKRLNNLIS
jgi:tetratricopeptide (TPR) repeat protein